MTDYTGAAVVGWIVLMLWLLWVRHRRRAGTVTMKKCPHCAELIQLEANVCRHCQRKV